MICKDRPSGVPDVELTDEILDYIKDGAAYVLLDLGNGWKFHPLDTETNGSLGAAVQALKEAKIRAAWKESDLRKRTQKDPIRHKEMRRLALEEIRNRFDDRFKNPWVVRDPNQWPAWRGLLGDLAGRE